MNEILKETTRESSASVLGGHLQAVETHLNILLEDLETLLTDAEADQVAANEDLHEIEWARSLEGFHTKAVTIRRILDRFHHADLPTRRYLKHHLDEEFAALKEAYAILRTEFTANSVNKDVETK